MSKRYVISGIGNRAHSWLKSASGDYGDVATIVGLCDPVPERVEEAIASYGLSSARGYTSFLQMLEETRPDTAIIVTPERYHARQIIAALERGCDVATEKPLCLSVAECEAIVAAEKRAGRRICMGFNYRHIPLASRVRELLLSGEIGRPVSVDLTWYLDYRGHGASYFRRWHRHMAESGGLLVTKATHHFDLVNWWMDARPQRVYARGRQNFFGPGNNPYTGERCSTCAHGTECDWYTPVNAQAPDYEKLSQELGYRVRGVANYPRDFCPFGDDVDIYDTMGVMVEYAGGGILNYSLNAGVPFEGWNLAINGTGGRLETRITDAKPDPDGAARYKVLSREGRRQSEEHFRIVEWPDHYRILVMPHEGAARWIDVPNILLGHGGGDWALFESLFRGTTREDPLGAFAGAVDGAWSVAIGAAANESIATGQPVALPVF